MAHFVPYVFLATVGAFALSSRGVRTADGPSLCAVLLGTTLTTAHFGAFRRDDFHAGFRQVDFSWSAREETRLDRLLLLADEIPRNASVCASEPEGAHLGNRPVLVALKERIDQADYIVFSFESLVFGRSRELLTSALRQGTYGVMDEQGDFVLLRRGGPIGRNEDVLERIH